MRKMLSILLTGAFVLAFGFPQVAAFGAVPMAGATLSNPALLPQGDDNGPGAVLGVPPLVPQGDDNGPGAVLGVPPLVPQITGTTS